MSDEPAIETAPSPFDLRAPLADSMRRHIAAQLATIPEGKRGALLIIADTEGARVHLAARIDNHWRVAFEAGKPWDGPASASVAVEATW